MYFMYNMNDIPKKDKYERYTEADLSGVELIEISPNDDNWWLDGDETHEWWPIYDPAFNNSSIPCRCVDEEDARRILMTALNVAAFERKYDC